MVGRQLWLIAEYVYEPEEEAIQNVEYRGCRNLVPSEATIRGVTCPTPIKSRCTRWKTAPPPAVSLTAKGHFEILTWVVGALTIDP
jgi:hypothetical protein